jgi:hypothetical protein
MTDVCHEIQLLVEMGLYNFLPMLALQCNPPASELLQLEAQATALG